MDNRLSIVLFYYKIIAYYLTHSLSILSDALESIVNVIAGFIGLYSLYIAAKPGDIEHPYGHGKAGLFPLQLRRINHRCRFFLYFTRRFRILFNKAKLKTT